MSCLGNSNGSVPALSNIMSSPAPVHTCSMHDSWLCSISMHSCGYPIADVTGSLLGLNQAPMRPTLCQCSVADVAEGDAGMRGLAVAGLQSHTHRPVVLRAPLTCLSALCFRQLDSLMLPGRHL